MRNINSFFSTMTGITVGVVISLRSGLQGGNGNVDLGALFEKALMGSKT